VDYVANGQLKKALWKENAIPDSAAFMQKIFDETRDGAFLKYLVDLSNPAQINIYPKIHAFTANLLPATEGTGAYARVDDVDPANMMATESAKTELFNRISAFMGSSGYNV